MSELTWQYPVIIVFALAAGGYVFHWLTRDANKPLPMDDERHCPRCKLRTTGPQSHDFLYCPFCAAKYPPLET
jgi:hypothetical protein